MHDYDIVHQTGEAMEATTSLGRYKHVYTMKELEERFQLSASTIKHLVKRGAFGRVLRIGRAVRIPAPGVEAFELTKLTPREDEKTVPLEDVE
jgi:predicted DNA-binding transcriptional regulator AlpA